jgi:hypothetical protein
MRKHYLFDSKLYYYLLHIVLFFYIYSVQFIGVPFGIGTRVFMGIMGFSMFLLEILKVKKPIVFNRPFLIVYFALFSISLVSLLSLLYNRTTDIEFFIKYPVSIIIIIFSSYFVTKLVSYKSKDENQIPVVMQLFINVVIIQIIIALIMFAFQPIRDILNTTQVTSDQELKVLEQTLEFRLVGFGSKFFGSGIVNGFALILIGSILRYNSHIKINVFKYTMSFLFLFVFGMMMARTTIIGVLLALGIVFWPKNSLGFNINQIKKNTKFLFYLLSIPIISVFGVFYFLPEVKESIELAYNFGFEMFINYFQSDSLESASTNQMKEMYVWPTSLKTYLIGDGLFSDIATGEYYMGTDIGILRLIYYFGVFGLFAYLYFQFQIIYAAYLKNRRFKYMFAVIFIYCLVLNYKGFTDLFFLNILFVLNNTYQVKSINEKNIIYNSISSK